MPKLSDWILSLLKQGSKPPQNPPPPDNNNNNNNNNNNDDDDDEREHVRERLPTLGICKEEDERKKEEKRNLRRERQEEQEKREQEIREEQERFTQQLILQMHGDENYCQPNRPYSPQHNVTRLPLYVYVIETRRTFSLQDFAGSLSETIQEQGKPSAIATLLAGVALNKVSETLRKSCLLDAKDIKELAHTHIKNIAELGSDYLIDLVQCHRMQQERQRGRERDQGLER